MDEGFVPAVSSIRELTIDRIVQNLGGGKLIMESEPVKRLSPPTGQRLQVIRTEMDDLAT